MFRSFTPRHAKQFWCESAYLVDHCHCSFFDSFRKIVELWQEVKIQMGIISHQQLVAETCLHFRLRRHRKETILSKCMALKSTITLSIHSCGFHSKSVLTVAKGHLLGWEWRLRKNHTVSVPPSIRIGTFWELDWKLDVFHMPPEQSIHDSLINELACHEAHKLESARVSATIWSKSELRKHNKPQSNYNPRLLLRQPAWLSLQPVVRACSRIATR